MTTKTRKNTTRKVVGSLGVLGAAAAVAGLGTFGTFTDSTAPVSTTVQSGTVDIDLAQPAAPIPVTTANFVPGDSLSRAVTLSNKGNSALAFITLNTKAQVSSILDTDSINGLQMSLKSCSVAWTQGGTAEAPTYTCSGTEKALRQGRVKTSHTFNSDLSSLQPNGTDHLVFTISLPTSADNNFQNLSSTFELVFEGTQRNGTAR
ncbi:TasA family protein [Geodermatophilus ruber]|uniref:Camelysin metallo-endopeptidase n=1 Tax=Geodermatophilus ruber TaxID=504800 RepID=A0A1I4DVE6_9ACTN|nr:TasA family protein [Geodermatophilus ruber]SFK96036.1 Camelysin metallo-endopeptidase [Geodermatophilus ruber]